MSISAYCQQVSKLLCAVNSVLERHRAQDTTPAKAPEWDKSGLLVPAGNLFITPQDWTAFHDDINKAFGQRTGILQAAMRAATRSTLDPDIRKRIKAVDKALRNYRLFTLAEGGTLLDWLRASGAMNDAQKGLAHFA